MAKQARRSRADREQLWRDLIERQHRSGQSIRKFCDSEGISQPSFYSWRKRLQESNGRPTAQFVPADRSGVGSSAAGTNRDPVQRWEVRSRRARFR